jgi:hypothetical protein
MARFIVPEEFPSDKVSLFAIIDEYEKMGRGWSDIGERASGFGIDWWENDMNLRQIFAYRVASIGQMERKRGINSWGYEFICYKTGVFGANEKQLTHESFESSADEYEIIGGAEHSSRYFPLAKDEAMFFAYRECRKEAEEISKRVDKEIIEIMHKHIMFTLRYKQGEWEQHKELGFIKKLIPPSEED